MVNTSIVVKVQRERERERERESWKQRRQGGMEGVFPPER
jgi:hypothetical protein